MAGNSAAPKYTNEAWEKLLEETVGKIKSLAATKGSEYSGDSDRLDNFRRNGADVGLPMETVWRVYAGKHWDALTTYIRDLQAGKQRTRSEPIDGRVDDLLVYLLLFKAMLEERQGTQECPHTQTFYDGNAGIIWYQKCLACAKVLNSGIGNPPIYSITDF